MRHWLSQEHGRDNNILRKKAYGFQDPKTSCPMADLFPNVDHVLLGNGSRRVDGGTTLNASQSPWMRHQRVKFSSERDKGRLYEGDERKAWLL
jgi:hypothetical protein